MLVLRFSEMNQLAPKIRTATTRPPTKKEAERMARFYVNGRAMTELMEWKSADLEEAALPEVDYTRLLLISSPSSEIDFLHGFEACSHLLCRAAGIQQCRRGKKLLSLWIKIGRPHPAI